MRILHTLIAVLACAALALPAQAQSDARAVAYAAIDPVFEAFMHERNVPGMVYGVVVGGKLAYVRALGVQDLKTNTPVTSDTVFRIASMSKNFTALAALKLRDEGKLAFDAPAETLIPEMKGWTYPTTDSPKITLRDLLSHSAGFVTDDPWGDRQLPMSEANFSALIKAGVPFERPPGMAFEYSNFGYTLVGRAVSNASGRNYADYITASFLVPLGMTSSGYDLAQAPAGRLAVGYRWQDGGWAEEPSLGPGTFGAMGGLNTTANDYARYMAWELAAWPPRDGPEDGILRRSSVREILHGSNVLMLPERGLGVFAFANRTYAGASPAVREAALKLVKSGAFPERTAPVRADLQAAALVAERIYAAGDVLAAREALAMNVLLDRDAPRRKEIGRAHV